MKILNLNDILKAIGDYLILSLISLFLKTPTSFLWGETCCNQNKAETEKLRVMKQLQSIKVEIYTHLWLHCWQAKHSKW